MPKNTEYEVKLLRTFEAVEQVRDAWSMMQRHPESDIDFFSFIGKIRTEIIRPHVISVSKGGQLVSLLAGRLEHSFFELKIGYKVIWRTKIRRIVIYYDGFMGDTNQEVAEVVIRKLLKSLREEKADMCLWNGVQPKTDLQMRLNRLPGIFCRDYLMRTVEHWKMTLPESLDELLEERMDKKQRYNAKRAMRLIEKQFPGKIRYTRFSAPDEMETLFRDVISIAKKTYQWGLGVGFRDDLEQKERLKLEAKHGWLRGYVLYVNNEPVGFWLCSIYQETVYSNYTGFDPQYRKQEVGTALFLNMIGELCRENARQFDFGLGEAFYKERFGDASFKETTLWVFAPSIRGVCLNGFRLLTEGGLELAKGILMRLKLDKKLKTAWRRRVTPAMAVQE